MATSYSFGRFFILGVRIWLFLRLWIERKIFFLKASDFVFSQGYLVEGQNLRSLRETFF